jgi:hyperosmotically inducible protein
MIPTQGADMKTVMLVPFLFASTCLLPACGRVGNHEGPPERATLDRPQPQVAVNSTPRPPSEAARAQMPPAEALSDSAITSRIAAALQADPAMKGADVSINTDKGVVVLSGTVASHEQTGVASAHAQRQDGVLRVDNHLRPEYS